MTEQVLESADIQRILKLLPHRYPFLMVDRIIEMNGDESCIGIKNVTANEPHFAGHFPEQPIMPGVLMIEGMAQTAGAICVALAAERREAKHRLFHDDRERPFPQAGSTGDTIEYHMKKMKSRANMWWFRGEAKVRGVLVAEAEISAMLVSGQS